MCTFRDETKTQITSSKNIQNLNYHCLWIIYYLRCIRRAPRFSVTMMTSSNENISALLAICAGNSSVPGEVPAHRPVTRSFDIFFDLRLDKRLCKQSWGWWFETLSCPLWRQCNVPQRVDPILSIRELVIFDRCLWYNQLTLSMNTTGCVWFTICYGFGLFEGVVMLSFNA